MADRLPYLKDDVEQVATALEEVSGSPFDMNARAARMLWHFAKGCPQISDLTHVPDKKPREVA